MAIPGQKIPSNMEELLDGIWKQNPVFVMVLGMCPTLAVTVSAPRFASMTSACTVPVSLSGPPVPSIGLAAAADAAPAATTTPATTRAVRRRVLRVLRV